MTAINVVFFSSDNSLASGAFLCLADICERLNRGGEDRALVVLPCHGDGESLLKQKNISFVYLKTFNWIRPAYHLSPAGRLKISVKRILNRIRIISARRILREFHADIVHMNTTYTYVGALAAESLDIPVIWHIREVVADHVDRCFWRPGLVKNVMGRADVLIAISDYVWRRFRDFIPEPDMRVIYDGVDTERFYNPDKGILDDDQISILCLGGLYKHKMVDQVIRYMKYIHDQGINNVKLKIAGRGGEEDSLHRLCRDLDAGAYVEFCHFTDTPEDMYRQADIFVINSCFEPFGRVTVEAMLSGDLVMGSDNGATPEITEGDRYGVIYRQGDSVDFYNRLMDVVNHRDVYKERARLGREHAREVFTADSNFDQVYRVYRQVSDR